MVTNIPFYSFKDSEWIKKHKRTALFLCFIASVLSFIFYKIIFAAGMMIYTLSSLLFYIKRRKSFGELFPWQEEDDH